MFDFDIILLHLKFLPHEVRRKGNYGPPMHWPYNVSKLKVLLNSINDPAFAIIAMCDSEFCYEYCSPNPHIYYL